MTTVVISFFYGKKLYYMYVHINLFITKRSTTEYMNRQINEIATVRLLQIQYLYKNKNEKKYRKTEQLKQKRISLQR